MAMKKGYLWTNKFKLGFKFSVVRDRTTTMQYENIDKPKISIR